MFTPEVMTVQADLNRAADNEVRAALRGHDAVVYTGGRDCRVVPRAPAYEYFRGANVDSAVRLIQLCRAAEVPRAVWLGSYFLHFDRIWPERRLAEVHPYIRSRKEQEEEAFAAASVDMDLMFLELPFVFGSVPGRRPLWAPVVDFIRSPLPLFCTSGGTNMVAVKHVAEAVVGAVERGEGGRRYVVGEENVAWRDWLARLAALAGSRNRPRILSPRAARVLMRGVRAWYRLRGLEAGVDPVRIVDVIADEMFFDPEPSRRALGYGRGGLAEALEETVKASLAPPAADQD